MIPQYSTDGAAVVDVFFGDLVDLLVFFEDQDCEALYEKLLCKLFNGVSTRAICLAGKKSVLDHSALPHRQQRAKNLYVLDKDFDDLLGSLINRANLFYLSKYSIENYLVEEAAVVELVLEEFPKKAPQEIGLVLAWANFFAGLRGPLLALVRGFVVVQKHDLPLRNAAEAADRFSDPQTMQICSIRVQAYIDQVVHLLVERHIAESVEAAQAILASTFGDDELWLHAPGKLLLALLYRHLNRRFGIHSITFESLAYRLAKNCTFDELAPLRTRAISLMTE